MCEVNSWTNKKERDKDERETHGLVQKYSVKVLAITTQSGSELFQYLRDFTSSKLPLSRK